MKKIICIFLATVLLLAGVPSVSAGNDNSVSFNDVPSDAWYKSGVDYCVSKGYFSGTGGNSFTPDKNLTREQFVTVLFYFAGYSISDWKGDTGYSDAPSDAWYAPYVKWAKTLGITSGIGNGKFGVGNDITREQFCKLLMNYANSLGINVYVKANISNYTDANQVSDWAVEAIRWAVNKGIMSGTSANTLSPKEITTRAQATRLFMQFDKIVNAGKVCKHVYDCKIIKSETATTTGTVKCVCKKCYHATTVTIAATGEVEKPSCEKNGHSYGEWVTVTEATKDKAGEKVRTCTVCGKEEKQEISKLSTNNSTRPINNNPSANIPKICTLCAGRGKSICGSCGGSGRSSAPRYSPTYNPIGGGFVPYVPSTPTYLPCASCSGTGCSTCPLCNGTGFRF